LAKVRITGPGGVSARWTKSGHIITSLERGEEYELSEQDGDFYRILIPAYVHVNLAAPIRETIFVPETFPFVGPDINNLVSSSDGGYACIQMMARYSQLPIEAERIIYAPTKIKDILGDKFEVGVKYFPEPPFIAHISYSLLVPLKRIKKLEGYIVVLDTNDKEILAHDPFDFDGAFKRFPMNDFLLAYRGTSIWLK